MKIVFVTGTGTGIGKTWWSAALARALRTLGARVSARKPAQSFAPGDQMTDAQVLGAATGEHPETVCPPTRWYELALAPPMAAAALGRPAFTVADLVDETAIPSDVDIALVEGAGGPRSPIAADGDNVDFAATLSPDRVLLIADAGLGTLNAVRLAAAPFATVSLVVALNRFDAHDPLHAANRSWLTETYGFQTVTEPEELARILTA